MTEPDAHHRLDLAAMLEHRLSAHLASELGPQYRGQIRLSVHARADDSTFRDLFRHPRPSIELLQTAKDYFREQAGPSAERRPDQQVSHLLYLITILVGRERGLAPISELSDTELLREIDWALAQSWLDKSTRALLLSGRKLLVSRRKSSEQ